MPAKMITPEQTAATLPTDMRTLLLRISLLCRYDMPGGYTITVPRELLEKIDVVLEE